MDRNSVADVIRDLTAFLSVNGKPRGREIGFLCPFHADTTPSADWNPEKGTFVCRVCGTSGGALKLGPALPGFTMPRMDTADGGGIKVVTEDLVNQNHERLLANPQALDFLLKKRFINLATVQKFKLGLTRSAETEFFYPVRTKDGWFPAARIYRPDAPKKKRRWWRPAFTKISSALHAPIFGAVEAISKARVFLCEGEDKALALAGLGFTALALTLGASAWRKEWMVEFEGKDVAFVPDVDPIGLTAIQKCETFMRAAGAKSLRIVELPLAGTPESKDVTDWLRDGGDADKLDLLIESSKVIFGGGVDVAVPPPPAPEPAPEAGDPAPRRSGLTDWGNAQRLVRIHGDQFRYCYEWGKWVVWDRRYWTPHADDMMGRFAKDVALDLHSEAARLMAQASREPDPARRTTLQAAAEATKAWAQTTEKADRLGAILKLAQSEPGIRIRPSELDQDHDLLNWQNGTLDLRTGTMRDFRRGDFITKISPIAYDADARCPAWEKFLREIMGGNEALVSYLQRALGYSMTGSVKEQVLFFMHGSGANGKSTFLKAVQGILGESYAKSAAPDILVSKDHQSHPTEIADLCGVRFVSTVEIGEGRRMAETLLKQLTGGDRAKARRMREDFWEFDPTHKIWLAANHKPEIEGTDYAVWRRIRMIPFLMKFEGESRDNDLPDKLKAEFSGIAAWMVRGCLSWRAGGLADPKEVLAATEAYKDEMDILGEFIQERCAVGGFNKTQASPLYEAFVAWHKKNRGGPPLTQNAFGRRLTERGFTREKGRGAFFWCGISISDADEEEARAGYWKDH